ncbi:MAG: Ig-like domain-containing protein [Candidatus Moraniibacteriota bacterium]
MKQNDNSIFSAMGVFSVGTAVIGLALVFFFGGGGGYGIVLGETTGSPNTGISTATSPLSTGTTADMSALSTVTAPTTTTTTPVTTTIPTTTSTSSSSHVTIGDGTAPDRPSRISAKIIDNRTVQLEWSASSDAVGVVGYRLFRNGTFLTSVTGTTYADRSVYEGQEYRYSVDAKDATGNTFARSEEKKIFIPRVTVQTGTTTANTTWTAENNGGGFIVKDSSGEVISGQKIVAPSPQSAPPVMDDTAKEIAARDAIKEAIRTGLITPGSENEFASTSSPDQLARLPEAQILDFDNDGLSNTDELRMGSDPYSKDTDHDGFNDGDEVGSGHDPKRFSPGDGRDKMIIEDVRSVIATEKTTPSQSGAHQDTKKDDRYQVKHVELVKSDTPDAKPTVRLSGTAVPNAMVTLFIYSTPTIVTVKADSMGNWSYDVDQDLESGDHEAFVAVTDNTGKITSYGEGIGFVKTAQAVTVRPIAEAAEAVSENQSPLERSQTEYFFAAFIAILFFSGAALIVVSRKNVGPIVS